MTTVDPATVPARPWFERGVHDVAGDLLGAFVTRRSPLGDVTLRVTEVEAYDGERDPGSHAFRGPSARNRAMYGEAGRLYVYRHLGLHHCVNVVCAPGGRAAAVLLRAGEVTAGVELARSRRLAKGRCDTDRQIARGPARLAVALDLDLDEYGADLVDPAGAVVVHLPEPVRAGDVEGCVGRGSDRGARREIRTGPRVGVSGAGGDGALYPWRYWLADEPTVSDYRAVPPRRR